MGLISLVAICFFIPEKEIPRAKPLERKIFFLECLLEKKEYIPEKYIGKFERAQGCWKDDLYDPEKYITYWDCGQYGSLVCTCKEVFRYAKPKTWLCLEDNGLVVRIIGLK